MGHVHVECIYLHTMDQKLHVLCSTVLVSQGGDPLFEPKDKISFILGNPPTVEHLVFGHLHVYNSILQHFSPPTVDGSKAGEGEYPYG
jgi:hypothetical protein